MPLVLDNIDLKLVDRLRELMEISHAADFCVGYFHLRGWRKVDDLVQRFDGVDGRQARVLVGMTTHPEQDLLDGLRLLQEDGSDRRHAKQRETRLVESFRRQLTVGLPDNATQFGLRRLARQLRAGQVVVKLFLPYSLHAKLYLTYSNHPGAPVYGFVGSSNLTGPGLSEQGELNVDVTDSDTTAKLRAWFEARWNDPLARDVSQRLAEIIEQSWACETPFPPYLVYLKMAYHLAFEALEAPREYQLPREFQEIVLPFQRQAILRVRRMLRADPEYPQRGKVAIIGDVVGMGKTLTAAAVAKLFQYDEGGRCIVCCPPKLKPMWDGYLQKYAIAGEVVPYSQSHRLREQQGRCRLLILDESHNLRNRETKAWANIRDFVIDQDARILLLSATPYNKHYDDLANQLRLGLDDKADLGVRPERYFSASREDLFVSRFQASPRSLVAFEQSTSADDWRDLLRFFMVRRTRGFIIKNYAEFDPERQRHFLTLAGGIRSYFPKRVPHALKFAIQPGDQYARLFNARVVDTIAALQLPRYGLGGYIDDQKLETASQREREILDNLSQAGQRLLGYCKTNLFKRLESSGYAFLLSLKRHALRNLVFVHALDHGLDLPVGTQDSYVLDTATSDQDADAPLPLDDPDTEEAPSPDTGTPPAGTSPGLADLQRQAAAVYDLYVEGREAGRRQFKWISPRFFRSEMRDELLADAERLLQLVRDAGDWRPGQDAKLARLFELLTGREKESKVLVFTQFADTANYVARELAARGLDHVEPVTAASPNPVDLVRRFSPESNQHELRPGETPLRVLIATEVLSEGQNCQDASVVVNYDLPWAIIRLIQRAGRVDRIGQDNAEIRIYSCIPAEGVDDLIDLRGRLVGRLKANRDVIGTDEQFFDEELAESDTSAGREALRDLYTEKDDLFTAPDDAEDVDIASLAEGVWKRALEQDPSLEAKVRALPDQVAATRHQEAGQGTLVYFKTADGFDSLLKVGRDGQVLTQSLVAVLREAECAPDEEALPTHPIHHDLVRDGIRAAIREHVAQDGVLGPRNSARRRVYERLAGYRTDVAARGDLFSPSRLQAIEPVINDLFRHPLTERARDVLNRRLREGINDDDLADLAIGLRDENLLTRAVEVTVNQDPDLICSIGLFPKAEVSNPEETR